jgi:histidyl-tRNA synthetase
MKAAATVEPRLSRGLRDLLPAEMIARQKMIDTIRGVYELYGFVPLSTPAVEYFDVLKGAGAGAEAAQSIFTVSNPEEEALGLRFDLTVPLSRVIAQYKDLPRPFRRYQVASVWRADKPGPGRFREFTQFDLDSVGVPSEVADTEIVAGMCDTLRALAVGGFRVRFSSRALLNLLLRFAGIHEEQGADVFRVLDKLDKVGAAKVRLELTRGYTDESGDKIPGVGLASEQVDRLEAFLAIRHDDRREVLAGVRELFAQVEGAADEIAVVERISNHLFALGYGNDEVSLDLSIARGLAYYTGPVFEAVLTEAPQFGSVFGGGRYDGLVTRFLDERVPATGASIGVDRLLAALLHLGKLREQKATARVLVTTLDGGLTSDYLAMTYELRRAGIPTEMYLGEARVGKQLKYADAWGIPICLLVGSNEAAGGVVTVKDMEVGRLRTGEVGARADWLRERPGQREVPRTDLVATIRTMLAELEAADEAAR